jgi:hypothetical protein
MLVRQNDKGLGKKVLSQDCAGFGFGNKAHQCLHTVGMWPLMQRRGRIK